MKLHEDKDAFGLLLENIHEKTGYRTDVLEKDYYVLLILQELSNFQADGLPAYFKGGTALYKALKTTNRFSEDIDLRKFRFIHMILLLLLIRTMHCNVLAS